MSNPNIKVEIYDIRSGVETKTLDCIDITIETAVRAAGKKVLFVLDTSESMIGAKLSCAIQAISDALNTFRKSGVSSHLISFNDSTSLAALTDDDEQNREILTRIKGGGKTNFCEIFRTLRYFLLSTKGDIRIIFMTDGMDTYSTDGELRVAVTQLAEVARRGNTAFYTIGINKEHDTILLDALSRAGSVHGVYKCTKSGADFAQALKQAEDWAVEDKFPVSIIVAGKRYSVNTQKTANTGSVDVFAGNMMGSFTNPIILEIKLTHDTQTHIVPATRIIPSAYKKTYAYIEYNKRLMSAFAGARKTAKSGAEPKIVEQENIVKHNLLEIARDIFEKTISFQFTFSQAKKCLGYIHSIISATQDEWTNSSDQLIDEIISRNIKYIALDENTNDIITDISLLELLLDGLYAWATGQPKKYQYDYIVPSSINVGAYALFVQISKYVRDTIRYDEPFRILSQCSARGDAGAVALTETCANLMKDAAASGENWARNIYADTISTGFVVSSSDLMTALTMIKSARDIPADKASRHMIQLLKDFMGAALTKIMADPASRLRILREIFLLETEEVAAEYKRAAIQTAAVEIYANKYRSEIASLDKISDEDVMKCTTRALTVDHVFHTIVSVCSMYDVIVRVGAFMNSDDISRAVLSVAHLLVADTTESIIAWRISACKFLLEREQVRLQEDMEFELRKGIGELFAETTNMEAVAGILTGIKFGNGIDEFVSILQTKKCAAAFDKLKIIATGHYNGKQIIMDIPAGGWKPSKKNMYRLWKNNAEISKQEWLSLFPLNAREIECRYDVAETTTHTR